MVKRLLPFLLVLCVPLLLAAPAIAKFEIESAEVSTRNADGTPDIQAGSHPFEFATTFHVGGQEEVREEEWRPVADMKDVSLKLPPGFVGDPNATPKCPLTLFYASNPKKASHNLCPDGTAVGHAITYAGFFYYKNPVDLSSPIYNLESNPGVAATFGYQVHGESIFLETTVRNGQDYGLTTTVHNIPTLLELYGSQITIWGVPADPRHDPIRGQCAAQNEDDSGSESEGNCPASEPELPLLINPTSCHAPRSATLSIDTWEEPGSFISKTVPLPELANCEKEDFSPTLNVTPDGTAGSTATGLGVDLHLPSEPTLNGSGQAEADVKNTKVTLPAGVQLNPSAADGLMACSEAQFGLHSGELSTCPTASKVGTVEVDTPLLPEPLFGSAYLAAQEANPFGRLVALYVVIENKTFGVRVKLAGQVSLDPVTGQIVTTFDETPQLPFSDFKLQFFGTSRAPLATPALCGTYTTQSSIEPWSESGAAHPSSAFQITSGPGGSPCASPSPFAPSLTGGTTSIQAGGFSPFSLTMSREDGQQPLQAIRLHMPPGLLGLVSSVKQCPEAQANAGSCGPESEIGETTVSVGIGNDPVSVKGGKVFLTGPYNGAPYGLSIVNPAKAGPFDLENKTPCDCLVVRAKIEVDPRTAALTVTTDTTGPYAIPHILDGIPLQIQHINVTINRPGFTFNPTNCNKLQIGGSLTSSEGSSATLAVPFQVTNCATLAFKPGFKASTSGKTSRANGASLDVKLSYPAGSLGKAANIASVKVDLPKQLPSRLTTLQKACPDSTFNANPASCPAASRVGSATAITPILAGSLSGPAYFVSHGGAKFPELVIVLSGDNVTVELNGETFISKAGITSSTFRTVPDVPVSTFELKLPQGPDSALAANGNLCKSTLKMPTAFTAQNGVQIHQSTPIGVTGCPKHKAKKARKANTHHKHTTRK